MTGNDYLNPSDIKAQCDSAIWHLEQDNEALTMVEKALEAFVYAEEIQSKAYDALKRQISDYKTLIQAMRAANDSDISDFAVLGASVGDEVLDGETILRNQQLAWDEMISDENTAQDYEQDARKAKWPWESAYYSCMAELYNRMAETDLRIYKEWRAKEETFDAIDESTRGLFQGSEQLRQTALRGLQDIAGVFTNGVYMPDGNAAWRKELGQSYVERVLSVSEQGEIVINMREVEKILCKNKDKITTEEYGVIALAFLNADESELGQFLQYMMGDRTDVNTNFVENLARVGAGFSNSDYSEWTISQEKIYQLYLRVAVSSEIGLSHIQELRQTGNAERLNDMMRQREIMLQRLTMLRTVGAVGTFRGEVEAEYPALTVTKSEKGELLISFREMRIEGSDASPTCNNLGVSTITVEHTTLGSWIDNKAVANVEYQFADYFGYNSVFEDITSFIAEEGLGELIDKGTEVYSARIAKKTGSELLEGITGKIPLVGDVAFFALDVAMEKEQARQDAEFIKGRFDELKSATIYSDFDCCANFVQYDTAQNIQHVIYAYPGELTDQRISQLNEKFNTTFSREQLLSRPNETWEQVEEIYNDLSKQEVYDSIMSNKRRN